jgi:hypothetical protein
MLLKLLVSLAAVSTVLAYAPQTAIACSCVAFTKPDYARQATLVFTGTVTRMEFHGGPLVFSSMDPVDVVFDVESVYKGEITETFQVSTTRGDASCGYTFVVGRRYTVFPRLTNERFEAGSCNGTVEGAIDPQSYLLGSGYPPGEDPPQTARTLIVAGAVLATLAFIALERRNRRSPPASAV